MQWDLAFQQRIDLKTIIHRQPDLRQVFEAGTAEASWCDSNNGELLPIDDYCRSEDPCVAGEAPTPKIMTQHDDGRCAGIVVLRNNDATEGSSDTKSLKIIPCDHAGVDTL